MAKMVKLGPKLHGTSSTWDECGKTDISQILISHQQDYINSIQFLYNSGGKPVFSETRGEPNGWKFDMVVFDNAEFLTSISGEYRRGERLASIVFHTNKNKYGPFGSTTVHERRNKSNLDEAYANQEFKYEFGPMSGNQHKCCFGGFHGSVSDGCVDSIGVYVKPLEAHHHISKPRVKSVN